MTNNLELGPPASDDEALLALWITSMRADGLAERTITDRVQTARRLCALTGRTLLTLDEHTIRGRLALLDNPASKFSTAGKIRALTRWMQDAGVRVDNPGAKVHPKPPEYLPRPASDKAIVAMLAATDDWAVPVIVTLALFAGYRVHEIAKVHGRGFDLHSNTLRVQGKGRRTGDLPMHPEVVELAKRMPRDGYWFPSPVRPGMPVSRHWVMGRFRRAAEAVDARITCHQLRHSYGTDLRRRGVDLREVQEALRHKNLNTTAIYTEVVSDEVRAAILRLPSLAERAAELGGAA